MTLIIRIKLKKRKQAPESTNFTAHSKLQLTHPYDFRQKRFSAKMITSKFLADFLGPLSWLLEKGCALFHEIIDVFILQNRLHFMAVIRVPFLHFDVTAGSRCCCCCSVINIQACALEAKCTGHLLCRQVCCW